MTRQPARFREGGSSSRWRDCVDAAAVVALLLTASACDSFRWTEFSAESDSSGGSRASSADSAVGAAGGGSSEVPPILGTAPPVGPAASSGVVEVPAGSPAPVDAATYPIGTAPDLVLLGSGLGVPVSGVSRAQLRDSYTEARGARVHEALDILAPRGTPVVSATDGRLLRLFDSRAGGLMVYATDPSERFILLYGHLDGYAEGVSDGMPLRRGQLIGYVGTTGNAAPDTPHLHFGILRGNPAVSWSEGTAVNPYPLLAPARPAP